MHIIADGLARLVAPILPVTADELWQHLPGHVDDSVHLADFPSNLAALTDTALEGRWARLMKLREAVNAELEKLRQAKVVGKSLEATVILRPTGAMTELLQRYRSDLPTLFITSDVVIDTAADTGAVTGATYQDADGSTVGISVARADGTRCDRCWRYVPVVSSEAHHAGLCPRCEQAVTEARA
jgi:isoleucyl-tRNA synthetase